ncbi:hypothetical protein BJY04DRAFT_218885 [Aspergillus karnatakaensis]|uniref:uncharacterized protein n=1 Tax=Aspergillus karnatakaensis TaxID=1810916 RepID=UPI003CCD14EF
MAYISPPTPRSPVLLLTFPQEILQSILTPIIIHEISSRTKYLSKPFSHPTIPFKRIISSTKTLRAVCPLFAATTRSLALHGKSTRGGYLLRIRQLFTTAQITLFPFLRDCIIELDSPYNLPYLSSLHHTVQTTTYSLAYISAIDWTPDDTMDIMRRKVSHMGYGPLVTPLTENFIHLSLAAGLKLADSNATFPNGGTKAESQRLREPAMQALKTFFVKEILALWYTNAQLVRQILGLFPGLQYAVLPAFLHIPLLSERQSFFPSLDTDDDSPFASIISSPPTILDISKITYTPGGPKYIDLMTSLEEVQTHASCYNPVLAMFPDRARRVHYSTHAFLVFNGWVGSGEVFAEDEIGVEVVEMLRGYIKGVVAEILDLEGGRPVLFQEGELEGVLDEEGEGEGEEGW